MTDAVQETIGQIQLIQQNLQNFAMQRQQLQIQEAENDAALKELEKSGKAFKIIGNIMVSSDVEVLKNDLNEKKQMISIRIKSIEKQEDKLKEKAESLQQEVLSKLDENKKSFSTDKE